MVRSPRLKKEDISLKTWKFGDVTDYVAAYSSDLDVAIILAKEDKSILVDELELEDEGVYTFVLVEDPKTLEKVLVLY